MEGPIRTTKGGDERTVRNAVKALVALQCLFLEKCYELVAVERLRLQESVVDAIHPKIFNGLLDAAIKAGYVKLDAFEGKELIVWANAHKQPPQFKKGTSHGISKNKSAAAAGTSNNGNGSDEPLVPPGRPSFPRK